MQPPQGSQAKKAPSDASWFVLFGLVGQLGYVIAIPAVLFVVGGSFLDRYLDTSPLFVLVGIPLAFVVSAMGVWRIVRTIQSVGSGRQ